MIKKRCIYFLLLIGCSVICRAQTNEAAMAAADTTHFSKNTSGGWLLYNSYVAAEGADSIRLELILQYNDSLNWDAEHFIGKIKTAGFFPQQERMVSFFLFPCWYKVRIETNGNCYLQWQSGEAPVNYPVIIPFAVLYKQ